MNNETIKKEAIKAVKEHMKNYYTSEKVVDVSACYESHTDWVVFGTIFTVSKNHIIAKYTYEYNVAEKSLEYVHYEKMMY